jgi:hypothetical protein
MSVFVRARHAFMTALSMAVLTCFSPLYLSASSVVVGSCKNLVHFSTIQQAVNAVPGGSIIYVCPGTYPEQVLIKKSLSLIGVGSNGLSGASASGADNPVIASPAAGVVMNASDLSDGSSIGAQIAVITPPGAAKPITVNVDFLTVDGANNQIGGCGPPDDFVGIYYQNASGGIHQVAARNQALTAADDGCQSGDAIFVQSGYSSGGSATVTIVNNSVHGYQKNGITVDGSGTVADVSGNYVVGQGPTTGAAENGIQVSDGANGSVEHNVVTDNVYINPSNCSASVPPFCFGASGILIYDSGATSGSPLTIEGNTISTAQLSIIAVGDNLGTADYNTVTSNRVTGTQSAGVFLDDGIDLCSNHNKASSNTVYNSSASGIHIDSTCVESTGPSGNNTTVADNTINEACAGVLTGSGTGNSQSGNLFYNVVKTVEAGNSCPVSASAAATRAKIKLKALPRRP